MITFGFRVSLAYTAGVLIGANVVSLRAVIGLLSFVTAFPKFKLLFTLLSICYLLYIAFKIAISKGHPTPINRPADIGIFDGLGCGIITNLDRHLQVIQNSKVERIPVEKRPIMD